jgi:hypothetical protein
MSANHPETKISVYDWSQDIDKLKIDDDFLMEHSSNHMVYGRARWGFDHMTPIKEIQKKYKNVGLVLGIDKPRITLDNNEYKLYFLDMVAVHTLVDQPSSLVDNNMHFELFYWSPDSVLMLKKQAHAMVKFIESVPGFRSFVKWPTSNPVHRQWYENSSRPILYPSIDLEVFQAAKGTEFTIGMDRLLFPLGLKDSIMGRQKDNFTYLQKIIDAKYFKKSPEDVPMIAPFISKMYTIKKINS